MYEQDKLVTSSRIVGNSVTITFPRESLGDFLGVLSHASKRIRIHIASCDELGKLEDLIYLTRQFDLTESICEAVSEAILDNPKPSTH